MGEVTHGTTTYYGSKAIEQIRKTLEMATPGDWIWAGTNDTSIAQEVEAFKMNLEFGTPNEMHGVQVKDPNGPLYLNIAIAGNGPNSRNNAMFLAMAPQMIRHLLREVEEKDRQLAEYRRARIVGNGRHA